MKKGFSHLVLSACLLNLTWISAPTSAAEIEQYERKYISFFSSNQPSLDQILNQAMQSQLPRFAYQAISVPGLDLQGFAQTLYQYQEDHAGDIAAQKELPNLRFGDQVVSWEQTRRIIDSAFILVPVWHFGDLDFKRLREDRGSWYVDLASDLKLDLQIYQLKQGQAHLYTQLESQWEVTDPIQVNDITGIVASLKNETGGLVSPSNPLLQPLIIEALKALPAYQAHLQADPARRMAPAAQTLLAKDGFGLLFKTMKQQAAFGLKAQVDAFENDKLKVSLPPGETVSSLGAGLDHSYKLIEYQQISGVETPVTIGFARVRELAGQTLALQPIQVMREPEIGDQLLEYPQLGVQFEFLGGTTAIGFDGSAQSSLMPQGAFRINYNLAKATGVSELYAHLTGSITAPLGMSSLSSSQLGTVSKDAFALPIIGEAGLIKRWYLRQFIFELGAQAGLLGGFLFNAQVNDDVPYTLSPGGTLLAGVGFQLSPDMLIGLQGGWRFFLPSKWTTSSDKGPTNVDLPGLASNGPVAQVYASFMF